MATRAKGGIKISGHIRFGPVNTPPVWISPNGSLGQINEVTAINITLVATDEDNSPVTPVTYTLIAGALPTGSNLVGDTISGPAISVGSDTPFAFTIQASDGLDLVQREFTLTVLQNLEPIWQTAPVLDSFHVSQAINTTVTANDGGNTFPAASITYELISGALPTGSSLNTSNGDITGPAAPVAPYNFTIRAFDGIDFTDETFSLTVNANVAPDWDAIGGTPAGSLGAVNVGASDSFQVTALDEDGLPAAITYTVISGSLPGGYLLGFTDGAIEGTAEDPGLNTTFTFTVRADDGLDTTDRQFSIDVDNVVLSISNSLLFDDGSSEYLNRTPAIGGSGDEWTFSVWIKRADLIETDHHIFDAWIDASNFVYIRFSSNKFHLVSGVAGVFQVNVSSTGDYRDPSAWYHIVWNYDSITTNVSKVYVNGDLIITETGVTDTSVVNNSAALHKLGAFAGSGGAGTFFDGYFAEVNFVDGSAVGPEYFGFEDDNGDWQPKAYTETGSSYGTNGFRLTFSDNSPVADLGLDTSGNANTWTTNNFVADDQTTDSPGPTTNYSVMNVLDLEPGVVLSGGNLEVSPGTGSVYSTVRSTMQLNSGLKWYWRVKIITTTTTVNPYIGLFRGSNKSPTNTSNHTLIDGSFGIIAGTTAIGSEGRWKQDNGALQSTIGTWTAGEFIDFAFDPDTGKLWLGENGTWIGVSNQTDPENGLNPLTTLTIADDWHTASSMHPNMTATPHHEYKFGATDTLTPPTGFVTLNTSNLATPTIADPSDYFIIKTYTGNGSFSPGLTIDTGMSTVDMIWGKNRDVSGEHSLADSVRGDTIILQSNTNLSEADIGTSTNFFNDINAGSGGPGTYHVGNYVPINGDGNSIVTWNWKAGTPVIGTTQGSGTLKSYNGSVSVDAGFSIITYEGNQTGGHQIPHHLEAIPDLIIVKNRDLDNRSWIIYHSSNTSAPETDFLRLESTNATVDLDTTWNDTAPTSSVFTVGTGGETNENTLNMLAYVWTSVEGFSKFGSYVGNAKVSGPFVYCGFRPVFVMIKRTDIAGQWYIHDTARDIINVAGKELYPNLPNAEAPAQRLDFVSNGIKIRTDGADHNATATATYVYAAFAESPFKTARAR